MIKKHNTTIPALIFAVSLLASCRTTSFDDLGTETERERTGLSDDEITSMVEEEIAEEEAAAEEEELLKEIDFQQTVIYIEKPVYVPATEASEYDRPALTGIDAAKASTEEAIQDPEKWDGGTMYYDYDEDFTYNIYCQPFRVTDLILEPGEIILTNPFLSEQGVWEMGAGVSKTNGLDTQHFFIKPSYSGLETSFIIITDRRVYHFMLLSYRDCYMSQVKFNYPLSMPYVITNGSSVSGSGMIQNGYSSQNSSSSQITTFTDETLIEIDPSYLSFNYVMSYSLFKKPYWLPTRVFDDGKKTYIIMDEEVLHKETPALFDGKDELINYSVSKNTIIINELIERVTLRIGNQKVTIRKKR